MKIHHRGNANDSLSPLSQGVVFLIVPAMDDYGFHKKCFELQFKMYHSV